MKLVFIISSIYFFVGCVSSSSIDELSGSYEQNAGKFQSNTFAFAHNSNEYYFGSLYLESGKNKCNFFVGYKNNKLKYFFPAYRLAELRKVYNKDQTVEQKISKTLEKINSFEVVNQKCTSKIAERQMSFAEGLATVVVYSPFIVIAIPFMVEPVIKSLKEEVILRRVKKLKLGMSLEQVKKVLSKKLRAKKSKHYMDYYLDIGKSRLVMYFKGNQLFAMVYGYHYEDRKK